MNIGIWREYLYLRNSIPLKVNPLYRYITCWRKTSQSSARCECLRTSFNLLILSVMINIGVGAFRRVISAIPVRKFTPNTRAMGRRRMFTTAILINTEWAGYSLDMSKDMRGILRNACKKVFSDIKVRWFTHTSIEAIGGLNLPSGGRIHWRKAH